MRVRDIRRENGYDGCRNEARASSIFLPDEIGYENADRPQQSADNSGHQIIEILVVGECIEQRTAEYDVAGRVISDCIQVNQHMVGMLVSDGIERSSLSHLDRDKCDCVFIRM